MHQDCQHILDNNYTKSLQGRKIFKDQCVRCFRDPKHALGLFVCLKCFNGFCCGHIAAHQSTHSHPLYVQITEVLKPLQQKKEISKLAIGIQGGAIGEDQYQNFYKLWCSKCSREVPEGQSALEAQIKSLINSHSPFKKHSLVAWEVQVRPCQHTLTLQQQLKNKNLEHCADCALSTNLWLCLTCGNTGCGRKNYDGTGGNGHGIGHFQKSGHPLVVKLGTITAEGEASIYCYSCNNDVKDQQLREHLAYLGINVGSQKKTEKTVTELNLDMNLNFALSKLVEGQQKEVPLYGPGFTGISNIGNTCYMNSVLQLLNALPEYQQQYSTNGKQHISTCNKIPGDCFYCQVSKIFCGLNSGDYSAKLHKTITINDIQIQEQYQQGIKPFDFKILIARDNAQFSSGRQQDALQYLQWLFDRLDKEEPFLGYSTTKSFNFQAVNRLVCQGCNGYKVVQVKTNEWKFPVPRPTQQHIEAYYKQLDQLDSETKKAKLCQDPEYQVKMQHCLNSLKHGNPVVANCPKCKAEKVFLSREYFKTTPRYLLAIPNRFILQNWVPKKLNALIEVDQHLSVAEFLIHNAGAVGQKLQAAEGPKYSASNVIELVNMGFSQNAAKRALVQSKDNLQAATNWIMENMDNYAINDPIDQPKQGSAALSNQSLTQLLEFGFNQTQAKVALLKNGNNQEAALEWLMNVEGDVSSEMHLLAAQQKAGLKAAQLAKQAPQHINYRLKAVIIHLGKSVHSGHYVAYVRSGQDWVLFNDQRVTKSTHPVLGKGYVYLYEGL